MNREVMDRWCERGLLGLVLAILVFGPLAMGAMREQDFLVIEGLTVGVLLLWAVRLWVNRRAQLLWPPICWAVVAFTAYALARYSTADIEYVARQEWLHVLVYAFLFLAILNNLQGQEITQWVSLTLIFLAMAISCYAIYQFVTGSDHVYGFVSPYPHRGSGTYICPNHLGGFLEMLLPLALAYTLAGRLKPVVKILLGYAALVMLVGIGVTLSRGSWVSIGVALLLLFGVLLGHRNYRLPALVLLVGLVGAGVLVLPKSHFIKRRIDQAFAGRPNQQMENTRFALWSAAARMWEDHPWWGVGPDHYNYRFGMYRPQTVQLSPVRAHNDYLNTLADWGLAGTILVTGAWILLGVGVARTWPYVRRSPESLGRQTGSNKFAFVLGATLGLVAILVHSLVDFNFHIPANAILAVALMAWLTSHQRFATERWWVGLRPWSKALASLALLTGIAYLGQQGQRQAIEYVWLNRANHAPNLSLERAGLLERAFATEPMNPKTAFDIGEAYRIQSMGGGTNSDELASRAMKWYERSAKLNPWNSEVVLDHGLCLDWLGRPADAAPYFDRADKLDPNNYFIAAYIGRHYISLGDYAAAKPWLERSLRLNWWDNPVAQSYFQLAQSRLLEAATNEFSAKLAFPAH